MKKGFFLFPVFVLLAMLLFLTARQASAQSADTVVTDDDVNAVAKELYCPVCENIPLDVCPTQACTDWREEIRLKLSEGWTKEQIKTYFLDRFGDRVLGAPPARGMNWLVYVLPPAAILAGAYLLFRVYQSWKKNTPAPALPAPDAATPADRYAQLLEEQLKQRQ
jgi:cytochrome c-type biogenesis protein CcmH